MSKKAVGSGNNIANTNTTNNNNDDDETPIGNGTKL